MADDPLYGFKPVQQPAANDPLMGFKPTSTAPAASAPTTQDLGSTAIWDKPAAASWSDYILAHMANAVKPLSGIADPRQNLNEALTLGSGLTGGASGFIPGVRERTAQASQELDPQTRMALEGAGYLLGPGKLGIASRIGEAAAPTIGAWAGGALGSAAEGAGASALGAAGAGQSPEDIAKSAAIGGAGGGVLGSFGGVVGRGGELPPARSVADLKTDADQHWTALTGTPVANQDIGSAAVRARNAILSDPSIAHLDSSKTLNTLSDLQTQSMGMGTGAAARKAIAPVANLNIKSPGASPATIVNSAIDDLKGQGVVGNRAAPELETLLRNTPGQGPAGQSNAFDIAQGAKAASGQLKDVNRLNDWVAASQVGKGAGPDVGVQARSYLLSDEGKAFAPPGSTPYDAYNTLAATAGDPMSTGSGLSYWDVKHHLLWPAVGMGVSQIGGALGSYEGGEKHPWWLMPAEDVAGLGAGFLLKNRMAAVRAATQQSAIDAARVALSTGQQQAPVLPAAPVRDALRKLWFGAGAGGNF